MLRYAGGGDKLVEAAFRKPPRVYGNWKAFDKLALGTVQLAWFLAPFVSG